MKVSGTKNISRIELRHLQIGAWYNINGGKKKNNGGIIDIMITSSTRTRQISQSVQRPPINYVTDDHDDDAGETTNILEEIMEIMKQIIKRMMEIIQQQITKEEGDQLMMIQMIQQNVKEVKEVDQIKKK